MKKKKTYLWHEDYHSNLWSKRTVSYALLPKQGKGNIGKGRNAVSSASDMRSSYFCWVYKYTQTRERKITPCSKLYCCSPIHFCTQNGVRPWLMYLRSILDGQFSTGNPMFLHLFRFQGSLGSAQSWNVEIIASTAVNWPTCCAHLYHLDF